MSLEAWGDCDEDRELPEGCWSECEAKDAQEAVMRLFNEAVYEDGKKDNGISVRFIARMQALKYYTHISGLDDPLVADAQRILGDDF